MCYCLCYWSTTFSFSFLFSFSFVSPFSASFPFSHLYRPRTGLDPNTLISVRPTASSRSLSSRSFHSNNLSLAPSRSPSGLRPTLQFSCTYTRPYLDASLWWNKNQNFKKSKDVADSEFTQKLDHCQFRFVWVIHRVLCLMSKRHAPICVRSELQQRFR